MIIVSFYAWMLGKQVNTVELSKPVTFGPKFLGFNMQVASLYSWISTEMSHCGNL